MTTILGAPGVRHCPTCETEERALASAPCWNCGGRTKVGPVPFNGYQSERHWSWPAPTHLARTLETRERP